MIAERVRRIIFVGSATLALNALFAPAVDLDGRYAGRGFLLSPSFSKVVTESLTVTLYRVDVPSLAAQTIAICGITIAAAFYRGRRDRDAE